MREITQTKEYVRAGEFIYLYSEDASRDNLGQKARIMTPHDPCAVSYEAVSVATPQSYRWMMCSSSISPRERS